MQGLSPCTRRHFTNPVRYEERGSHKEPDANFSQWSDFKNAAHERVDEVGGYRDEEHHQNWIDRLNLRGQHLSGPLLTKRFKIVKEVIHLFCLMNPGRLDLIKQGLDHGNQQVERNQVQDGRQTVGAESYQEEFHTIRWDMDELVLA